MSDADASVHVRRAARADLPALGRLGAHLMRVHYEFDRRRFVAPTGNPETGYARFLGTQLDADDAIVLVAERDGAAVGYVFAGIEPFSWRSCVTPPASSTTSSSTRRNAAAASPPR